MIGGSVRSGGDPSGDFPAAWLDLREPADARARSPVFTRRAAAWANQLTQARGQARSGRPLRILDLGAGTGSNWRFLAPRLPGPQEWLLVDHDPALLALSRRRWPVTANGQPCGVRSRVLDLDRTSLTELFQGQDLVTTSALLDLVSEPWAQALAETLRVRGGAFLAVLTFDGRVAWSPADPDDDVITALINRHQRQDKGFGPALGPAAAAVIPKLLQAAGAAVAVAPSDWVLDSGAMAIQRRLVDEWSRAASAVAPKQAPEIAAWAGRREHFIGQECSILRVGHIDVFARWLEPHMPDRSSRQSSKMS